MCAISGTKEKNATMMSSSRWLRVALVLLLMGSTMMASLAQDTPDHLRHDYHRRREQSSGGGFFSSVLQRVFARSSYCRRQSKGVYKTQRVWSLAGVWNRWWRGDVPGACVDVCASAAICNHQPCTNDYTLSDNSTVCRCRASGAKSICGSQAQCLFDNTCRCPPGLVGDPMTACTRSAAKSLAIAPEALKQSYATCGNLTSDLTDAARYLVNAAIDRNVRWYFHADFYYGYPIGGFGIRGPTDGFTGAPTTGGNAPTTTVTAPPPVTDTSYDTNVQEAGVDEPDVLKSDGVRVYAAYGNEIVVLDAATTKVLNRVAVPTNTTECSTNVLGLLLMEGRLVVLTNNYCYYPLYPVDASLVASPIIQGQQQTKIFVYNTADMALLTSKDVAGNYMDGRAVGSVAYIVTTRYLDTYTALLQYLDPYRTDIYGDKIASEATYRAKALAEADKHIPAFVDELVKELNDCSAVQKIVLMQNDDSVQLSFSSLLESVAAIHSFDVTDLEGTLKTKNMLLPASGGLTVYGSPNRLVLAIQGYWVADLNGNAAANENTYLLTYRLNGTNVAFSALGTAPGYLLNQFSIDHETKNKKDYIRVATTTSGQWGVVADGSWQQVVRSTNQLVVFEESSSGNTLTKVGELDNIGKPGERIFSVRFLGDRAFVVTFEQIDPFVTVDLTDPTKPRVAGELQIPGFSNYLHPIGDDLILGVGQGANSAGQTTGLQVSLFNVSDLSAPVRIQNYIEKGGYSTAQYDHKAFRYLNNSEILILPLTIYDNTQGLDGFRLYKVDKIDGIAPYMDISHASGDFIYRGCFSNGYLEPRTVVFAGEILSAKGHTFQSHNLTTKAKITEIDLDKNLQPQICYPYFAVGTTVGVSPTP